MEKVAAEAYSGLAKFGRFKAVIGVIVMLIVAGVLILIGVLQLKETHTGSASMTITEATCTPVTTTSTNKNGSTSTTRFNCVCTVTFVASDGKTYTVPNVMLNHSAPYTVGAEVTLRYDPANPTSVTSSMSPKIVALILFLFAGVMGIGSIVGLVVTFKFKPLAAAQGAGDLMRTAFGRRSGGGKRR